MTKERLQQLIEVLDMTRKLISIDIYYCIYDTDCIVQYIYPEDGDKDGIHIGSKFHDPTGKLDEVLATEKHIHNFIPLESFGFVMEGNLIPVYEDGRLCGAITSAYVPMNQQQLAARELAVQAIYYLIMSIDMKNNNHCARLYFDYEKQQFPTDAQHFDDFCEKSIPYVHPEDAAAFRDFTEVTRVRERLQKEKTLSMECRLRSVSGEYRWAELILTRATEYEASEEYTTAVYMVRDIHERKSKELEILQKNQELIAQLEEHNDMLFEQGMTDELTKVYNRKGLVWFGSRLLEEAKKRGQYIYTLVADMNGLKYINDKFGHEEGDKAIRAFADMLRQTAPAFAVMSRTGGDEFTVMAILEKDSPIPGQVEETLKKTMQEFNEQSGLPYMVDASCGWDMQAASELLGLDDCVTRADDRMYAMKASRRIFNRFSGRAQHEVDRRFGSAKHSIFILSADGRVQADIAALFDAGYQIFPLKTAADAVRQLELCDEMAMLFVDHQLPGQSGTQFVRELPEALRQKAIPILLAQQEDADVIQEAFALGMDDVLIQPYNTVLNKCRIHLLSQMHIATRKLSQLLEQ